MRHAADHFFLELQQQQRCCWGCGPIKEKFKKKIQRFLLRAKPQQSKTRFLQFLLRIRPS